MSNEQQERAKRLREQINQLKGMTSEPEHSPSSPREYVEKKMQEGRPKPSPTPKVQDNP